MKLTKEQEILKLMFKDLLTSYNSRSISKVVGISHSGAFKILRKLEKDEIVKSKNIGKARVYSINFDSTIACKEIEIALAIEAKNYNRWLEEFKGLEDKSEFVILFGSILVNSSSARDIDLLVVAEKDRFSEIKHIIKERNSVSNKKIHLILQNLSEFKRDIKKKNKVMVEIIKKGVALFSQDKLRGALTE